LQENTAHPREILQMKINDTAEKSNRFNAKGIVHGRLYKRIFYLESDSKWYSLELLRNREIIKKEHKIADSLWESFLKKVTSQNT
jgi:hypothetical protein